MKTSYETYLLILFVAITSVISLLCPINKECQKCQIKLHKINNSYVVPIYIPVSTIKCAINNNSVFDIRIEDRSFTTIDCINSSDLSDFSIHFDYNSLLIWQYYHIKFKNCHLPKNIKFIDIIRMLAVEHTAILTLESHESLTLKKYHLSGLERLKHLEIINSKNFKMIELSTFDELKMLIDLDLRDNSLTELQSGIFDQLIALKYLNVSTNSLIELPSNIFDKLVALKNLDISKNSLIKLQSSIFDKLIALEYLNVSTNPLTELSPNIFDKFVALKSLYISNNSLTKLPWNIFDKLIALEYLDVSTNSLIELPSNIFDKLVALKSLYISNNSLTKLPWNIFDKLVALKSLYISNNSLTKLPWNIFDTLVALESLHISNNFLTELSSNIFDKLVALKSLYISNNSLTKLPWNIFDKLVALKKLDISKNNLYFLAEYIFAKLRNLDTLYLNVNNFKQLPKNLLRNNKKLLKVYLSYNQQNLILPEGCFSNLSILEDLILSNNGLVSLPEDIFWGLSSLNKIKLNNNYLQHLSEKIFQDLTNLATLNLNSNNLEILPDYIFLNTRQLISLDLSDNRITSISKQLFHGLHSLEKLHIKKNHLKFISDDSFASLKKLMIVDLSSNHLTLQSYDKDSKFKSKSPFYNCILLKELNLANNNISKIFGDWTHTQLHKLDLSYNNIFSIKTKDLLFSSDDIVVNLTHNKIHDIFLYNTETMPQPHKRNVEIYVGNNPFNCVCIIYDFLRYVKSEMHSDVQNYIHIKEENLICYSPKKVKNLRIDDLLSQRYSKNFTCRVNKTDSITVCPERCDCFLNVKDKTFTFDCSDKNLTSVPSEVKKPDISFIRNFITIPADIILQFKLNFSKNRLTQMPLLKKLGHESMKTLILSHNNISEIPLDGLSNSIEILELHSNNVSRIDPDVLEFLINSDNLTYLTLHDNPWKCDCNATNFLHFVQTKYQKISEKSKLSRVICYGINKPVLSITAYDVCSTRFDLTMIYSSSITVALIGLIIGFIGLYYKYQRYIKIWLFAHQWCLWFVTEEELDKDKKYDAFVSFSHKDDDFVMDELIRELESGPSPYKLCFHYRDWLAGEWITNNIARSVENSKRTIVVLSPNFLESVWGRMEFRAAHCQALSDRRARVIMILYGDIGPTDNLDSELKAYISMNTYIQWGDPWFWDKLKYAMPHQSRRHSTIGYFRGS